MAMRWLFSAGTGLAVQLGMQAMINIGVAVRLLPAKGMTLPLISYGGSSLIAAGLGLGVLDAFTGEQRQPASLSGGEKFLASLSLALGLAEVVSAQAGGLALDTLFVDEGFGTLDEESLEQVLSVLDGLRDGGRVVGVVSHVGDLRSRIPAQVQVDKTSTGSSVTLLGCAPAVRASG